MTRNKVKLTYIADDSKRKATYKKRKNGLIKKTNEISTLCGIEACAIIYGPNETQPEVWPSHPEVQRVVNKFRTMPEHEQNKYMLNQESFLTKSIMKTRDQLKKLRNENKKIEMELFMFQCLSTGSTNNMVDSNDLLCVINQSLKEIEWKKSRVQPQQGTVEAAKPSNEGNTIVDAHNHIQGMMQSNMGPMQMQDWSFDSATGGGNLMLPFRDYNISNGFWHGPSFH
ncbi:unnamed protein product [Lupinus luteus]|uniref:MADS-box domain-containing protein n=1 Tax=Lupinus luteus TaxID=3873 RepID=A0AAV1YNS9_LUPLU